jgi:hypothetical protein
MSEDTKALGNVVEWMEDHGWALRSGSGAMQVKAPACLGLRIWLRVGLLCACTSAVVTALAALL